MRYLPSKYFCGTTWKFVVFSLEEHVGWCGQGHAGAEDGSIQSNAGGPWPPHGGLLICKYLHGEWSLLFSAWCSCCGTGISES